MSRIVCEKTLAFSFILSPIAYCNALFENLNDKQIQSQKLQNFAAKVILDKPLYDTRRPVQKMSEKPDSTTEEIRCHPQ